MQKNQYTNIKYTKPDFLILEHYCIRISEIKYIRRKFTIEEGIEIALYDGTTLLASDRLEDVQKVFRSQVNII